MEVFEIVIALLVGGAVLAAVARQVGVPYPSLVALAGAGLALIPGLPTMALDPALALALFVAPVLVDAAFGSSQRDLRANWRAVTGLALGAVALTIAVVAVIARMLVPDLPWTAAIALGAIVAPPDAAAATTVLKQLRPPHRLLVILEGESLFNDASALLVYRLAVGATAAGFLSGWSVVPMLLVVTLGSIVLGLVLSRLTIAVNSRISDVATAVVFQFCGTFLVWILAEQLHLSGIITVVVFAMAASRSAAERIPARLRIQSYAVWEVAVFVLNVLAFILIGLQLKPILDRLATAELVRYIEIAGAVCAAVILVRIVWVMGFVLLGRWAGERKLKARGATVVAWCGMRGIVTLAAALALPAIPYRDLILFTAFCVVLVTLVLQGMTVTPLMRALALRDDGSVDREVQQARIETLRAGLAAVDDGPHDGEIVAFLRRKYAARLRHAERGGDQASDPERD